jgi:hypothetical protein
MTWSTFRWAPGCALTDLMIPFFAARNTFYRPHNTQHNTRHTDETLLPHSTRSMNRTCIFIASTTAICWPASTTWPACTPATHHTTPPLVTSHHSTAHDSLQEMRVPGMGHNRNLEVSFTTGGSMCLLNWCSNGLLTTTRCWLPYTLSK